MKKPTRAFLSCICFMTMLLGVGAIQSNASQDSLQDPICIYGPVLSTGDNRISINNNSNQSSAGEIILYISPEETRIIDAVTGFPVPLSELRQGETIYAYIGPAMTMSLPPMTNASLILCNIPADYKVPNYISIDTAADNTLTASDGTVYTLPDTCQYLPYLTRNLVTKDDLTRYNRCLVWSNYNNEASKIVMFAEDRKDISDSQTFSPYPGEWINNNDTWYYQKADGTLHTGWLLDNEKWYYLDPSTGAMLTGFILADGKAYYLQEDGSMLTRTATFTPDESGALYLTK